MDSVRLEAPDDVCMTLDRTFHVLAETKRAVGRETPAQGLARVSRSLILALSLNL